MKYLLSIALTIVFVIQLLNYATSTSGQEFHAFGLGFISALCFASWVLESVRGRHG